ncbi:MAG: cyclopropane-fatty-acyl-phospholipid synthase family protein [Pseudomonadota bacterium]|nr:cyclopropane-fatty-acyl-phospholipid synthase family protein [Pseudomonadota bacterium]
MDDLPTSHAAPLLVTPETVDDVSRGLPFAARRALGLAAGLVWGSLAVTIPDGRVLLFQGREPGLSAAMEIRSWRFAGRLARAGDLGFAEAYLRGEWDSPDLATFIELFARNRTLIETLLPDRPLVRVWQLFRHFLNRNTRGGARRNIHAHYDLGNRFYEAWLDRTMTYSSALFAPGDNDLASAQTRKYRALAEALELKPSHHVLEIGCGWGGFAAFAAEEIGCRVTGLTISKEQFAYARERIAAAGLSDRVEFKLQDYRDETGTYDCIASIEMFEAVGEAYWATFFRQMRDRLKAGGRAGLQVITIREESFANYRREIDFIRRYIFPGGMLPSPTIMRDLGARFSVPLSGERGFGLDYARTLSLWRSRFRAAWPQLVPLGFDERFRRLWEYYLAYCEAGFRTGNIDVKQMIFAKA